MTDRESPGGNGPARGSRPANAGTLTAVAVLALLGAAVTAGQALHVALTGEEFCVGEGCAVVGRLTRLSPAAFNLFGAAIFAAIAVLALVARRRSRVAPLLHALLVAALAAEGVLFAYQWHVAETWCIYCLGILGLVAVLNLVNGLRGFLPGLAAFAGAAAIFSLLTFVPARSTLDDGTAAVRKGTGPGDVYLIFSEDCPHCRAVLEAVAKADRCTIHFNPVEEIPPSLLPGLTLKEYRPEVNVAAARALGLETIPILLVRGEEESRTVSGEGPILKFLEENCSAEAAGNPILQPWSHPSLLPPDQEGCGLQLNCD